MKKNIIELFQESVLKYPQKTAVIFDDCKYSYSKLENDIKKYSYFLEQEGVKKGTHLILILENSYEYIVCMLSIANLGAVLIPVSTTIKQTSLEKSIDTTDASFIILHASKLKMMDKQLLSPKYIALETIYKAQINTEKYFLNKNKVSPEEDYILTMTSGSTGDPKPIVFTQETKIQRALLAAKDLYNLDSDDTIITASPLYHSMGQRLVLLPLLIGATSVLLKKFHHQRWIEHMQNYKVTFTIAIASHLNILVDKLDNNNIDSLQTLVSSSAPLTTEVKQKLIEKLACEFHECYGASEVGIVTNLDAKTSHQYIQSVGKALEFVDIKIVNEQKEEVPIGVIGEIIAKSTTSFSRYYNNPQKTEESVVDGYFYTGDLGYLDKNDYLYFSGRKKDLIIVGGTNVYPIDVENVISRVEGVEEVAVVGIENDYFGEIIVAVLVINKNKFNLKNVKVACLRSLTDYQQPMQYLIVEKLPKNALGKIMKHKLKEEASSKLTASLQRIFK